MAVAADSLKKLKGDSLTVICYHAPYGKDAFNNADANARISYYVMWGFPYGKFNGTDSLIGGNTGCTSMFGSYRTKYNQQIAIPTPGVLSLKVNYSSTTRTGMIFVKFNSVDSITDPSLHLRYAVIENHMHYHFTCRDSLQSIERDMFPSASGVLFTINPGQTFVDSQSFSINSGWVDNKCYLPVFIQSDVPGLAKKVLISNEIPVYQRHVSGDANGDKVTTISDVVFLINYVFYHGPQSYPSASGDPNEDCVTDVGDVVYLIDYLYRGGPAPLRGWEID